MMQGSGERDDNIRRFQGNHLPQQQRNKRIWVEEVTRPQNASAEMHKKRRILSPTNPQFLVHNTAGADFEQSSNLNSAQYAHGTSYKRQRNPSDDMLFSLSDSQMLLDETAPGAPKKKIRGNEFLPDFSTARYDPTNDPSSLTMTLYEPNKNIPRPRDNEIGPGAKPSLSSPQNLYVAQQDVINNVMNDSGNSAFVRNLFDYTKPSHDTAVILWKRNAPKKESATNGRLGLSSSNGYINHHENIQFGEKNFNHDHDGPTIEEIFDDEKDNAMDVD